MDFVDIVLKVLMDIQVEMSCKPLDIGSEVQERVLAESYTHTHTHPGSVHMTMKYCYQGHREQPLGP